MSVNELLYSGSPTLSAPTSSPCQAMTRWTRNCGFASRRPGPELFGQPAAIRTTLQVNATTIDDIADRLTAGVQRSCWSVAAMRATMIAARQALECMLGVPWPTYAEPGVRVLPRAPGRRRHSRYRVVEFGVDDPHRRGAPHGSTSRIVYRCPDQHGRFDPGVRGRYIAEHRRQPWSAGPRSRPPRRSHCSWNWLSGWASGASRPRPHRCALPSMSFPTSWRRRSAGSTR